MDPTYSLGISLVFDLLQIIFSLPKLLSCCHAITIRPAGGWGPLALLSHQLYVGSCFWSQPPRSPWPSHLASSWGLGLQPSGFNSPSAHTHHPGFEFALVFEIWAIPFLSSAAVISNCFIVFYTMCGYIHMCVGGGCLYQLRPKSLSVVISCHHCLSHWLQDTMS